MLKKKSLRQLLEEEEGAILCPETYDCISAQCMELCGFKVNLMSSAEFGGSQYGALSDAIVEPGEVARITSRITSSTTIPFIVDADTGYGTYMQTYDACKRIAQAGAGGILITDSEPGGITRQLSIKDAKKRYMAAKEAMEGTDCLLLARTDVPPYTPEGFDEACDRLNHYRDAGADITLIGQVMYGSDDDFKRANLEWDKLDMCKEIAKRVPGWKYYPDLGTSLATGKSDIDIKDLAPLDYKLVGIHFTMYAAIQGILDYGMRIVEDNNNEYFNMHLEDVMKKAFPNAEQPIIPMQLLQRVIDPMKETWDKYRDEGMKGRLRFGASNPK